MGEQDKCIQRIINLLPCKTTFTVYTYNKLKTIIFNYHIVYLHVRANMTFDQMNNLRKQPPIQAQHNLY